MRKVEHMKRLLLAAIAAATLAGCSGGSGSFKEEVLCWDDSSYLVTNGGQVVPSPETLQGFEDFDCMGAA